MRTKTFQGNNTCVIGVRGKIATYSPTQRCSTKGLSLLEPARSFLSNKIILPIHYMAPLNSSLRHRDTNDPK